MEAADLEALERELETEILLKSSIDFLAWSWPLITGAPLVRNYAVDALAAVLQAVADGELTRTLIALPPGVGKTTELACNSAWRLARNPGHRSIHGSHAFEVAATESRRVRRFIEGDAFRDRFPGVRLRDDESRVDHWATDKDGRYIAVGVGGALTGRRGHEGVLDDPLNAIDRFSKAARDSLWSWFQESFSTRLDGDLAPITIVQQRLDRDDLIGRLLELGGWTLVELPAEYDPRRMCIVVGRSGAELWRDSRTTEGELLAANVLSQAKLETIKRDIGSATFATQFNQAPSDDSSAVIKRAFWRFHHPPHVAPNAPRPAGCDTTHAAIATPKGFDRVVIACDLTFGSTRGDYAVAEVWGAVGVARFLLAMWRRRAGLLESVAAIKALQREWPLAQDHH